VGRKCREIIFEELVSRISRANSELIFTRKYEDATNLLYEITRDICKSRGNNSVTVRVKAKDIYDYYSTKLLVTLDVERSQLSSQYLIVIKSVMRL
jgi:hypothetical protein